MVTGKTQKSKAGHLMVASEKELGMTRYSPQGGASVTPFFLLGPTS